MDDIQRITEVLDQQKGELLAVESVLISLFLTMQAEDRARLREELSIETRMARGAIQKQTHPPAVLTGFDAKIRSLDTRLR